MCLVLIDWLIDWYVLKKNPHIHSSLKNYAFLFIKHNCSRTLHMSRNSWGFGVYPLHSSRGSSINHTRGLGLWFRRERLLVLSTRGSCKISVQACAFVREEPAGSSLDSHFLCTMNIPKCVVVVGDWFHKQSPKTSAFVKLGCSQDSSVAFVLGTGFDPQSPLPTCWHSCTRCHYVDFTCRPTFIHCK